RPVFEASGGGIASGAGAPASIPGWEASFAVAASVPGSGPGPLSAGSALEHATREARRVEETSEKQCARGVMSALTAAAVPPVNEPTTFKKGVLFEVVPAI